jgi:hypothetical protein
LLTGSTGPSRVVRTALKPGGSAPDGVGALLVAQLDSTWSAPRSRERFDPPLTEPRDVVVQRISRFDTSWGALDR